jgi:STE24 endopeptidase
VLPWAVGVLALPGIADVAGLPILMLATAIVSLAFDPLERALSRWRESRADRTALEITGKPEAFASAMVKLHDENLSVARPPRFIEFLLMTHPAAWRRVSAARAFPGRALK